MSYAFDTLAYTRRLEGAGIARNQAEAHAEAARDFVMADLVTKSDLDMRLSASETRMTIRVGGMIVVAFGLLLAVLPFIIK